MFFILIVIKKNNDRSAKKSSRLDHIFIFYGLRFDRGVFYTFIMLLFAAGVYPSLQG